MSQYNRIKDEEVEIIYTAQDDYWVVVFSNDEYGDFFEFKKKGNELHELSSAYYINKILKDQFEGYEDIGSFTISIEKLMTDD